MKLLHRDIIAGRRFDKRFSNGEDSLFMFSVSDRVRSVEFTSPKAVYYRRIRFGSATTSKRSVWAVMANEWRLFCAKIRLIGSNPHYDTLFFLSRCAASIKTIINA